MYYSAGTYESFAHPEKPKDVDKKSAYIIGTGTGRADRSLLSGTRRTDEGRTYPPVLRNWSLRAAAVTDSKDVTKGFYHAWRSGNG